MKKAPKYWAKAKRILSKRDKVMRKLIANYKDGNLISRNDVFFSLLCCRFEIHFANFPCTAVLLQHKIGQTKQL